VKALVLVVEDDRPFARIVARFLEGRDYHVCIASTVAEAKKALTDKPVDTVVSDLRLPDADGLDLLRWIRRRNDAVPVLIITAYGTVEGAVQAVHEGAYHFLTKPVDLEQLGILIERALEHSRLGREVFRLRRILSQQHRFEGILSRSGVMASLLETVSRVATSGATVLVQGESGTGKELVAEAIHRLSPRNSGPFVAVNCAALPGGVLESELFGHERGAFTGAVCQRRGKFEAADRGTLFLDEIGDCPPEVQVRLLRILQEKTFERVGGEKSVRSDFRLVAATNRDLPTLVAEGKFREDLLFRLRVITVTVPPLRDRVEDIEILAQHFLGQIARREGKGIHGMSESFRMALKRHRWPGNVRELQHVVERAVILSKGNWLHSADLPHPLRGMAEECVTGADGGGPVSFVLPGSWPRLEEVERLYIGEVLRTCDGNKKKAARILGVTRRTLYNKVNQYGWMDTGDDGGDHAIS
jgi:DNA-binding NtrC family response regulator